MLIKILLSLCCYGGDERGTPACQIHSIVRREPGAKTIDEGNDCESDYMWRCGIDSNYTHLQMLARFWEVRSGCRLKAFCFESYLCVFLCVNECICK